MTQLTWGRSYLMCRPDFFDVVYEINPWMHTKVTADPERAQLQWENLVTTLKSAGAAVELQPPVAGLPDLVFTANAGVVSGDKFVPAHFRYQERQGETSKDIDWFARRDFEIIGLPEGLDFEGAGDALPFAGTFVAGYRTRSDIASHLAVSRSLGVPVRSVELTDARLYHLDLTFCPLNEEQAIVAPIGWDSYGRKAIEALVPDAIVLDEDETYAFSANSVVVGTTIVMPSCSARLGKQLEARGFDIVVCNMDEFLKAGGGCRCLTLALDVNLKPPRSPGVDDVD